jgi:hypothetical protein
LQIADYPKSDAICNLQFEICNKDFPGPALVQASSALAQPRTARLLSGKRAYYS